MKRSSLFIIAATFSAQFAMGQGFYDDDIYYNPSKVKNTTVVTTQKTASTYTDFEAPEYQVYSTSPRDVDEYNRRGVYAQRDSVSTDSLKADSDVFQYTERMERFDNPTIVISSGDSRLKELYYADNVNIYIGTPSTYFSFGTYSPWWSTYSYYNDFWYGYNYWNWGWGWHSYRPYCSWGWCDPFWGSSYHYGWGGYDWGYPHHHHGGGWHPNYTDGGRRPISGHMNNGGRRPALASEAGGFRGGDSYRTTGRRPSSSSYTPINSQPSRINNNRPTTTYNGYRGSSSSSYQSSQSSGRRPSTSIDRSPSYTNPNRSTNSTPTYRQSTNNSGSSSFGGYRGGSSSGGSHGSFGGGSRGGRR